LLYEYGRGVAQDYGEAMRWLRSAADQGYAAAQLDIGVLYEYGRGWRRTMARRRATTSSPPTRGTLRRRTI